MANTVWDEVTYPFPNFNGVTVIIMIDVITYQAEI